MNSILNEDDDLRDTEEDDGKRYYDENERTRSLLSSMPAPPVVSLKVGAKVLCTQKLVAWGLLSGSEMLQRGCKLTCCPHMTWHLAWIKI